MLREGTLKSGITLPLHCWDVVSLNLAEVSPVLKRKSELSILTGYGKMFKWSNNLTKILSSPYEALVLTDNSTKITWVNTGFSNMTGYSSKEVLGKSPKMLQGKNTSQNSRRIFRQKLNRSSIFTQQLVNYRKTGDEYLCSVTIYPLFNQYKVVSHFLALEKEIK